MAADAEDAAVASRLRTSWRLVAILAAGLFVAVAQACASSPAAVVVRELGAATSTASGQPIRLPQGDVRFVLSEYVIPAGARLPVHKHPYPRVVVVDAGSLAVTNVETGETANYAAGDMIVEAVDQWHFGVNTGASPVRLFVLDQVPGGRSSNTVIRGTSP